MVCSKNKGLNNNVKFFDLGHGAKSTINMTAISNNRFVMLHDEGDDKHDMEIGAVNQTLPVQGGAVNASLPPQGDSQEVVLETQPEYMAV